MIELDLNKLAESAEESFKEFESMVGTKFSKEDRPIFKDIFCSGYRKALSDIVNMIETQSFQVKAQC